MTQGRMSLPVAIPRALTHYRRALAMEASGLVMTRAWFAPGLRVPPHAHGTASVAVVLRGGWDGALDRQVSAVHGGDTVLVTPAGARHWNAFFPAETEVVVVELEPERSRLGPEYRSLLAEPVMLHQRGLSGLAYRLAAELSDPDAHSALLCEGLALELLATVARSVGNERGTTRPGWLDRAEECLRAGLSRGWTLDALSRALGLEPTRLVRGFRRHLRTTPADYLRQLRVDVARRLLSETERPIADIALETGFTDQSHLTRVFRRSLGETPAAFRRRFRHG
jgi:AraC family transcriptional regulator